MAEENKPASDASDKGTQSATAADVSMNIEQVERLASSDPSFRESDEYKDLMASLKGSQQADSEDDDDEDEEEDDDDIEDSDADSDDDDDEEDEDEEDVFGLAKKPKKEKVIKIDFKAPDEMLELLDKRFGIKDTSTFFNSVETWRTQAQEATNIKKQYDAVVADISALPIEIKEAVDLWAKGEDHLKAFDKQTRLDWGSDFEKQNQESLVQHYLTEEYQDLKDQLDAEEIDETEFKKQIGIMAKSQRRVFNGDKQALEKERADYAAKIANEEKLYKSSALASVTNLSKAYPNFTKSNLNKVRNTLVEGKLDDLFLNPDGSYKEEAAELVAYAMYGKQMAERLIKRGEKKGISKANIELVDKSPKSIRKQRSADTQGFSKEQSAAVQHLIGGDKKRSIFD